MTTKLYVDTTTHETFSFHEKCPHGSWEQRYDYSVDNINLSGCGEEITIHGDHVAGDILYVLSMIYKRGDSFGSATGEGEVLWVFDEYWKAEDAILDIQEQEGCNTLDFIDYLGNKIKLSNPVSCYFSHCEKYVIDELLLEGNI